ncbi:MAG TPA: energy transducer TonB [Blastocatellia bacterium]|nr:energy transducer TonB [Blastocatellia bacterium]
MQKGPFEKQALSSAREMPASGLDEALPNRIFADWIKEIVGPNAGVVWQLTECGEQIGVPGQPGYDLPVCAEINATMPDGRRVFVAISVGTFKKGLVGKPSFFRAVIEQNEQFHQVRRLRDLPKMLSPSTVLDAAVAKNRIADLPAIKLDSAPIVSHFHNPASLAPLTSSFLPGDRAQSQTEESPPAPPPPLPLSSQLMENPEMVPESVSQSRAITRVKPDYPQAARKMNATGKVEVEVIISETGIVIQASAVSGHLALRAAAVEAARNWVFEPAMFNGAPVKVKSILTFVFAPSSK